jgi:hypothetical protein
MNDPRNRPTLLEELDRRQEEVLQQLDELNWQVEALIGQFAVHAKQDCPVRGSLPPHMA